MVFYRPFPDAKLLPHGVLVFIFPSLTLVEKIIIFPFSPALSFLSELLADLDSGKWTGLQELRLYWQLLIVAWALLGSSHVNILQQKGKSKRSSWKERAREACKEGTSRDSEVELRGPSKCKQNIFRFHTCFFEEFFGFESFHLRQQWTGLGRQDRPLNLSSLAPIWG